MKSRPSKAVMGVGERVNFRNWLEIPDTLVVCMCCQFIEGGNHQCVRERETEGCVLVVDHEHNFMSC